MFSTMFSAVNVTFVQVAALVYAENHFLARTPMRWVLIAEYVAKCMQELSTANDPLMVLGIKSSAMPADFHCSSDVCKNTFALISSHHPELVSYAQHQATVIFSDPSRMSAFKPVVLLPHVLSCCGKPVYLK